jgi:carbonic anhydrase
MPLFRTTTLLVVSLAIVGLRADDQQPTGAEALARLKAGNDRFAHDAAQGQPIGHDRRAVLAKGQSPFASILSCADSRVPPEIVFNQGLGDLFVVRAAGEVADRSVIASLEYGVEHLHTSLLVVLGHEMCGAVKAASESTGHGSLGPNLDYLLKAIQPAVARAASAPEQQRLKTAILANVDQQIQDTLQASTLLRTHVEEHKLTIVGAYYELESGQVTFGEPTQRMAEVKRAAGAK